jgi:hypothetical protein
MLGVHHLLKEGLRGDNVVQRSFGAEICSPHGGRRIRGECKLIVVEFALKPVNHDGVEAHIIDEEVNVVVIAAVVCSVNNTHAVDKGWVGGCGYVTHCA